VCGGVASALRRMRGAEASEGGEQTGMKKGSQGPGGAFAARGVSKRKAIRGRQGGKKHGEPPYSRNAETCDFLVKRKRRGDKERRREGKKRAMEQIHESARRGSPTEECPTATCAMKAPGREEG